MGASGGRSSHGPRLGLLALVAALFVLVPAARASAAGFKLEITKVGEGEVLCYVEPAEVDCGEEFEEGEEVALLALPELGYEFAGFSGDCDVVEGEECVVVMEGASPKKVTVTFALIENSLMTKHEGSGSGTVECEIESAPGPCESTYPEETVVTLIAKADSGSEFAGFGGDCEGAPEECKLQMLADRVATVTFNRVGGGGEGTDTSGSQPSSTVPPPPGKANVSGAGLYRGGKATLRLTCKGGGPCKGTVKLIAKLKVGGKAKKVTVGKASFSLPAGKSRTLTIKLSA